MAPPSWLDSDRSSLLMMLHNPSSAFLRWRVEGVKKRCQRHDRDTSSMIRDHGAHRLVFVLNRRNCTTRLMAAAASTLRGEAGRSLVLM